MLAFLFPLVGALAGQTASSGFVSGTAQVGALYTGGEYARPKLNKDNCGNFPDQVSVDFRSYITANTTFGTTQVGVLYWQDVSIPARQLVNPTSSTALRLVSAANCDEPVAARVLADNIPLNLGTDNFFRSTLYDVTTVSDLMADVCAGSDGGVRLRRAYCLGVRNSGGTGTVARGGDGPDIDTIPPGAPSRISAEPGDGYASVTLTAPSGVDSVEAQQMSYQLQVRRCSPASSTDGGMAPSDAGSLDAADLSGSDPCGPFLNNSGAQGSVATAGGLDNGVTWEIRAYAIDDFGNSGPPGPSVFVTPRKEYGFLDFYGGELQGCGCEQVGQGPWLGGGLLAGMIMVWRQRAGGRRKRS